MTPEPGPLEDAIAFAVRAHGAQLRKDRRTPYIVHPIGVLRLLSSRLSVVDPDLLRAAVLHDVLEDTATTPEELGARFGPKVLHLVQELTLPPTAHGTGVPTQEKTRHLVHGLRTISWEAVVIKLCDRWDNLSDSRQALWTPQKRSEFYAQTDEMLAALEERRRSTPPPGAWGPALDLGVAGVREALSTARAGVGRSSLPPAS